ncbi:MAG: AbrB/MazE/SpoVT family DNA-binding domain-containing protein [Candidatus Woesearchaeota archaeon]
MRRRLVKQGSNALTITLPSEWCKQNNLKAGEEVEIEEEPHKLTVLATGQGMPGIMETSIELSTAKPAVVRSVIGSLYRKGYDSVKVSYDNEITFRFVQQAASSLIGFEVFDRNQGSVTIKSLSIGSESDLHSSINKILHITVTMQQIFREDYISGRYSRLEEMEDYRQWSWRLRDYVTRLVVKQGKNLSVACSLAVLVWILEKISRDFKALYEICYDQKTKKDAETLKLYDRICGYYATLADCIRSTDIHKVEQILEKYSQLAESGVLLAQCPGKKVGLYIKLVEITRLIQGASSNLVDLNMRQWS